MNYIIIAVAMIVVFIMIFVAFSSDDREEDIGYLEGEDTYKPKDEGTVEKEPAKPEIALAEQVGEEEPAGLEQAEENNNVVSIEDGSSMFQQTSDAEEKKD